MMSRLVVPMVVVGMLCALLAGCGSNVNQDNYNKVAVGMSVSEVESILGKGTEEVSAGGVVGKMTGSGKIMTWKDGEKMITVTFANDRVTNKTANGL